MNGLRSCWDGGGGNMPAIAQLLHAHSHTIRQHSPQLQGPPGASSCGANFCRPQSSWKITHETRMAPRRPALATGLTEPLSSTREGLLRPVRGGRDNRSTLPRPSRAMSMCILNTISSRESKSQHRVHVRRRDVSDSFLLVLHASVVRHQISTGLQMHRALRIRDANAMLIEGELDLFEEAETDLLDIGPLHPHLHHHVDADLAERRHPNKRRWFFAIAW